jgi:hypothetical protein
MEKHICCICGKEFEGWGNDPCPVVMDEKAKCCDKCDMEVVLPARIKAMKKERPKNETSRTELLRAMSTIVSAINNEEVVYGWLSSGIADGDENLSDAELYENYGEDDNTFADIMSSFVRTMRRMVDDDEFDEEDRRKGNGYLYCDRVTSKLKEI